MKLKFLLAPVLVGAMALSACNDDPWEFVPGGQPTTEPTAIVQPSPTTLPTTAPTSTQGPNPYAAFADLNAILYSDLIPNPPVFMPGETPWTPDPDIYIMQVVDDGSSNVALVCNIPLGAADDGVIDLNDYPAGPRTTASACYGGALRPSGGSPVGSHQYVIRKDGDKGTVLSNVQIDKAISDTLNLGFGNIQASRYLVPDCAGGVCTDAQHAYVLEGSLASR